MKIEVEVDSEIADVLTVANLRDSLALYQRSSDDPQPTFDLTVASFKVVLDYYGADV